ncbi:thioredoxin-disulfide reductase [candidate division WWE3 bacterium]|uniref:Thioredoxin reductase n=1 Tax=candidate division WWE3 bacterium TaxID=2053526 RepID=A0A7X9E7E1_UNCKA|nr:thioredoxin-disulfide reductase [candidate division WWE3 bacterium]
MIDSSTIFDVIVLGSGPAGSTAALYTSRAFLKTLVVAGNPAGGQLTTTTKVENFPGFPDGISGSELIANIRTQIEKHGAFFMEENAVKVSGSFKDMFKVETDSGNVYKGRMLIIATGASARWLGLESEQRLIGKGVSACATCDGFFFKDKVIAVVGGGDAAMEESTYLSKFASKIYILVRGDKGKLRASKFMQKKAFENPKIEFLFNTEVKEVLGRDFVEGVKVINNKNEEEKIISDVKGLFVAIGHTPNTKFLDGFVELDEKGYIKSHEDNKTSVEGVYVAGDVHDFRYKQAITASGFGCAAAIEAVRFLSDNKPVS